MLRYFYILICTSLCFCYEYIEENQQLRKGNDNSETLKAKRAKSNVIQFDVASFLKNSAKTTHDYEPFAFKNNNRDQRTQSDYYYETPLNENIEKKGENPNDLDIDSDLSRTKEDTFEPDSQVFGEISKNENEPVSNRAIEIRNEQKEWLVDKDLVHPEKKCAFRDMKVPFFSRKPSTAKKQKKKFFCNSCAKTYTSADLNSDENSYIKYFKTKRAFDNLCPKCIRELFKRRKKEPQRAKQIHCSREFYQKGLTTRENIQNDKRPNIIASTNNKYENNIDLINTRPKRDDNEERERQLKELAEVEKKINHVHISTPKFNAVPY